MSRVTAAIPRSMHRISRVTGVIPRGFWRGIQRLSFRQYSFNRHTLIFAKRDNYINQYKPANFQNRLGTIMPIKAKTSDRVNSFSEVRKCSRILSQGFRSNSLFSKLPQEILVKIAGHTKTPGTCSQDESEKCAMTYFGKPELSLFT